MPKLRKTTPKTQTKEPPILRRLLDYGQKYDPKEPDQKAHLAKIPLSWQDLNVLYTELKLKDQTLSDLTGGIMARETITRGRGNHQPMRPATKIIFLTGLKYRPHILTHAPARYKAKAAK